MSLAKFPITPVDPPRSPGETLPTMYDLPSEAAEEPGLPDVRVSASQDVFHDLQPQLLSATLRLSDYGRDQIFTGTDVWFEEAERRDQVMDDGQVAGIPAEQVFQRIRVSLDLF